MGVCVRLNVSDVCECDGCVCVCQGECIECMCVCVRGGGGRRRRSRRKEEGGRKERIQN